MLFNRYVGGGPKWVIRRYRMIEAVEALKSPGVMPNLATLADAPGYADQSHFTNDFRSMTGQTPGAHLQRHSE